MEEFNTNLVSALRDPDVETLLTDIFRTANKQTNEAIQDLQNTVVKLHADPKSCDDTIAHLKTENSLMQERIDDLEQYSRKASIRVFGIPESTQGSTDDKLLQLYNTVMEVDPPVSIEDIEISHRIGKPQTPAPPPTDPGSSVNSDGSQAASASDGDSHGQTTSPSKPRTLIGRFASRRVKARVMGAKKKLRLIRSKDLDDIYISSVPPSDDLTQRRARLAYKAQVLVREKKISSTWVFDGRVLIKSNYNHIDGIKCESDLPQ